MKLVPFGKTGIRVSPVCLGTMTFGNEADEKTSVALMDHAYEVGINFFDTANSYSQGLSEEIVGRWLGGQREEIVLASKVYSPMGDGANDWGSSRRNIMLSVDKSLKRLGTDWLDVLYLHLWDGAAALEQSLMAVTSLVEQGKVMYCGVSNFAAWQTMKAAGVAGARGLAPIVCIQPMYNLVKRQAEVEILPQAHEEGIAVCPYNPLAAGLLTGKYHQGDTGRLRENDMYKKRYENPAYWESAGRFVEQAGQLGHPPAALALAWVMSHPDVTSTIIGARNMTQLKQTLEGVEIGLSVEERAALSALSDPPALATDR